MVRLRDHGQDVSGTEGAHFLFFDVRGHLVRVRQRRRHDDLDAAVVDAAAHGFYKNANERRHQLVDKVALNRLGAVAVQVEIECRAGGHLVEARRSPVLVRGVMYQLLGQQTVVVAAVERHAVVQHIVPRAEQRRHAQLVEHGVVRHLPMAWRGKAALLHPPRHALVVCCHLTVPQIWQHTSAASPGRKTRPRYLLG